MTPKTARERAEEALAVAERRVKKWTKKRNGLQVQLAGAEDELKVAKERRDYAAKHPDLATTGIIELPEKPEATEDRP